MANLWVAKERRRRELLRRVSFDPSISLVDSFPVATCRFARAHRCRRLAEESAFGYDEMSEQTFYGLRAHLRVRWPGAICAVSPAPANVHDLRVAEELLEGTEGWAVGDRNYWSPQLTERLKKTEGLALLAPYKAKKKEKEPWPRWLVQKAPKDRDGVLSTGRALRSQEDVGAGPLAPDQWPATQGAESHRGRLLLPASRALAAVLREASHRLNLHIGFAMCLLQPPQKSASIPGS